MSLMRLEICCAVGLRNSSSRQWLRSERSLVEYLSLQMQMMGILERWMVWIRSWMPPRSPPGGWSERQRSGSSNQGHARTWEGVKGKGWNSYNELLRCGRGRIRADDQEASQAHGQDIEGLGPPVRLTHGSAGVHVGYGGVVGHSTLM